MEIKISTEIIYLFRIKTNNLGVKYLDLNCAD
jgi:hypothetical protein